MGSRRAKSLTVFALIDADELLQYKLWLRVMYRRNGAPKTGAGSAYDLALSLPLPTAHEYNEYQLWAEGGSHAVPTFSSTGETQSPDSKTLQYTRAARCGHELHPGHPGALSRQQDGSEADVQMIAELVPWCPKCILSIHMQLVGKLWSRWIERGGPWQDTPKGITGDEYMQSRQAFRARKVDLSNAMEELDSIARLEMAWESAHPSTHIAPEVKECGAKEAVSAYHAHYANMEGSIHKEMAKEALSVKKVPQKAKKLTYSPGTPENKVSRPQGFYYRGAKLYDEACPNACPSDEGWADTALRKDWRFNVRQCRLLLCNKEISLPDVEYRELYDDASKERMVNGIEQWLKTIKSERIDKVTGELAATTDIFAVWNSEHGDDEELSFDSWMRIETLADTNMETYAFWLGDIGQEDYEELWGTQQDEPMEDVPKEDGSKEEVPKEGVPKEGVPKEDEPMEDEPMEDEPKEDEPKEDEPKEDEPKEDEPKEDEPKEDEPMEDEPMEDEPMEEEEFVDAMETVEEDGRDEEMF